MSTTSSQIAMFGDLNLTQPVLKALDDVGYETPSPIQAQTIPYMMQGKDVLGQAQTGTGKTAAFALPLLSRIRLKEYGPQVLVLAPTRELAIQVAEAFRRYAKHLNGFHVMPIYGGQDYNTQIKQLKRGVHVAVGTPGRVMDHIRRGTLNLGGLDTLVLDEADEMLRMGFIDDVKWILERCPERRQIALFSATMPGEIRTIANRYLQDPEQVTIKVKTSTADTIRQRYWMVSGLHKLDALTRILEAESFDAMIVFVRTKTATVELAEKLEARGYAAAAINGDMAQNLRERTINRLKKGGLDILVATDVAARGLDVDRISHVFNYDIPYDTEAYVHRIGRTGRAGRSGEAILFVAPREKRMLRAIEKATRKPIELMELPSTEVINDKRVARFKQKISDTLAEHDLHFFQQLLEQYENEHNIPAIEIAAALAKLVQGDTPLLLKPRPEKKSKPKSGKTRGENTDRPRSANKTVVPDEGMEIFRVEVGRDNDVKPGNLVGAIANEAGLESQYIGQIEIFDDHSLVCLPEGMPGEIFNHLKNTRVVGQRLKISRLDQVLNQKADKKNKPKKASPKKRKKNKASRDSSVN